MPKIRLKRTHRHLVAVDTNILWNREKNVVVSPAFEAFWSEHCGPFELSLVIPDTVRGELLFQQTTSAQKSLTRANEALSEASAVGGKPYRNHVTADRVAKDVESRFDQWAKRLRVVRRPVPFSTVDWAALAAAAIARSGPFTPDAKNPDAEKGFRDALILETVIDLAGSVPSGARCAFVCNDGALRNATESRGKGIGALICFESLIDFGSYLRLSREQLTQEFVLAIRSRAREKFFTRDDPASLYLAENINARVRAEHVSEFQWFGDSMLPGVSPLFQGNFITSPTIGASWAAISQESLWLDNPEFVKLEGDRHFHWKSTLRFVQLFRRQQLTPFIFAGMEPEERLRRLNFAIAWHAVIKADGRFQKLAVDSIALADKTFTAPSPEELVRFRVVKTEPVSGAAGGAT